MPEPSSQCRCCYAPMGTLAHQSSRCSDCLLAEEAFADNVKASSGRHVLGLEYRVARLERLMRTIASEEPPPGGHARSEGLIIREELATWEEETGG